MLLSTSDSFKIKLDQSYRMTLDDFEVLLEDESSVAISNGSKKRLGEVKGFIDFILKNEISSYGINTGVGSLRSKPISKENAKDLSVNLIRSHDAGIGASLPKDVILGAMIIRAHTLSKGFSGFSNEGLEILVGMINARIIPEIPETGSLGASGDLAFLARLGRSMMGDPVQVNFRNETLLASQALNIAKISSFVPREKEGLALINGTPFMSSMLAIGFNKEVQLLENLVACLGLFLNAVDADASAFCRSLQIARDQFGQTFVAELINPLLRHSNSQKEVQNDYCIRCIPQIFGPRVEIILEQKTKIEKELNAVTDNPLIFSADDISFDIPMKNRYQYQNTEWALVSGGNFHGENLTTIADIISLSNSKFAIALERQLAFLLNPLRNKGALPEYLIGDENKIGMYSGFMVPHYTASALVHKICLLAQPSSLMNSTSSNEVEDIVSYGATACSKLLKQIKLMEELLTIFLLTTAQAYSIVRLSYKNKNSTIEELFGTIADKINLPQTFEGGFDSSYKLCRMILDSGLMRTIIKFPIKKFLNNS